MSPRVAVVGAGVSGLVTAYRLRRATEAPDVVVFEASDRAGGKLGSVDVAGLSLPAGADSFVGRKPWAVELCRDLGIEDELVEPAASRAYVWTDRGLVPLPGRSAFGVPAGLDDLLRFPGLSFRGRIRCLGDLWRRVRKGDADESIGSLLRRRVGDEATDLLAGPLLAGLFAGDVDRLSVRATFPELAAWERDHGSLVAGARAAFAAPGAGPMFLRPRGGVERLTDVLAEAIGPDRILLGAPVTAIARGTSAGYVVRSAGALVEVDAVVLAVPPSDTARLLATLAPEAAATLEGIACASTAVALLVYPEGTAEALPDAAGFVVPRGKAAMTACTFLSSKWPDERYGDRAVLRCFVGAAGIEDVLDAPDEQILDALARQLAAVVALPGRAESSRLVRWERAMPQYEVGYLDRAAAVAEALPPGIFVVGQALAGVGIADCVRRAGESAEAVRSRVYGRPAREQESVP